MATPAPLVTSGHVSRAMCDVLCVRCKVRCPGHVTDSGQTDRCAGAEPGYRVLSWCEQCEENWWRPAAWDWAAAIMELALVTSSQHSVLSHSSRHRAEKLFSFISKSENFKPLLNSRILLSSVPIGFGGDTAFSGKGVNETSRKLSQYLERVPTRIFFNKISRVLTPTANFH